MRTNFFMVVLMGLITLTVYDADAGQMEFVYSELTADGRPVRYLLDANDEGHMVGSVPSITPEGSLDGFMRNVDGTAVFWTTPDRLVFPTRDQQCRKGRGHQCPHRWWLARGLSTRPRRQ